MATAPYFHWPPHSSAGAPDNDAVPGFGSGAPEMAALVSPDQCARPRTRRSSSGSGKQQQQKGSKKPPQRGLGVAELERLRCGGDPLRELAGVVPGGDAQVHPLMQCRHHHHAPAASAFEAGYCPSLLVQHPPALAAPRPAAPGCYVHHPVSAPEQQYFVDLWGRMGACGGGDHQAQPPPPQMAPEHPSSQSSIWRPAASSSSCLQSGHHCDLCSRRMMRKLTEACAPPPPPPPNPSPTTMPDYSIYDLAAAMATSRQGEAAAFVVKDRKRGALIDEAPAKKEAREIEFFPAAASTHHDGSEFAAPVASSPYGAGSCAAAPLDLSLRL